MPQKNSTSSCYGKWLVPQKYSLPINLTNRDELLLPYKLYAKKLCKKIFFKQLYIRIDERYKIRNRELKIKLKKLDDALDHVRSITEYDEEYFQIVNGRPLFHCIPLFKTLTGVMNKRLRAVQDIGYKNDSALNIDTKFRIEQNIHDLTLQRLFEEAKTLDKFILEDYKISMRLLDEEEELNFKLDAKMSELQSLADKSYSIMSRLLGLDYKYSLQQKYGRFLYYLSPPIWRSNNREFARSIEIEAKGFDYGNLDNEDTFTSLFEKMRKECVAPIKPVLYFTHPQDLFDIFNGIEKILLYNFSRASHLVPHTKLIKDSIRMLKQKIQDDSAVVTASIMRFRNLLSFCEERSVYLKEKFFKVLHGFFYEAVGTLDVLKLTYHLEFCYGKLFNEKPMNLDMLTIARAIESIYMNYSKQLDSVQSGSVRGAMRKCMDLNDQMMHTAKRAAKELRLFHRLERELLGAHNLLSQDDHHENIKSTYVSKQKLKRNPSKYRVSKRSYPALNDAEMDYLTLFTDWTKNEDPSLYIQSLNSDKDKNTENACNS